MTHEEIKLLLNDYFDERLSIEANSQIQIHLAECDECSQHIFELHDLMKKADELERKVRPPEGFWNKVFSAISEVKIESIKQQEELDKKESEQNFEVDEEDRKRREKRIKAEKELERQRNKFSLLEKIKKPAILYSIIGIASVLILYLLYSLLLAGGKSWEVKKQTIGTDNYSEAYSKLSENDFLETDQISRLQIQVPHIGKVIIDPGTKVQRLSANNILLIKGSLLASKDGAKQFLTVEVPGAAIKDYYLGSNYRVSTSSENKSALEMFDGWVTVKSADYEMLVLSNHSCLISADSGIGLPYLKGSSKQFIDALNNYWSVTPRSEEALVVILTAADVNNCATLWNLLRIVERKQRGMIINTLFGLLGEFPLGVNEEGLKILDPVMLTKLIESIEPRI